MINFTLESLTHKHIEVAEPKFTIVGQQVLSQRITIVAIALRQCLIALCEVVGGTLNKCGYEGEVLGEGLAVGEVQLVIKLVILIFPANHVKKVDRYRSGSNNTVNNSVSLQQAVGEQHVGYTQVAMYIVIVCTKPVRVVVVL